MRQGFGRYVALAGTASLAVLSAPNAVAQGNSRITTTGVLRTPTASPPPETAPTPMPAAEPEITQAEPSEAPVPEGPPVEDGGRLDLMCFGRGAANKTDVATAFGSSSVLGTFGSAYGTSTATVVGRRSQQFDDQVSLFIQGDEGRLRMPRTMLPVIRGGENGWFRLRDIRITRNEITASVAVNLINNPKLRLDRFTGAISISGKAGDYAGECRRYDPEQAERQF